MQATSPSPRPSAFRHGLFFGLLLGGVLILLDGILNGASVGKLLPVALGEAGATILLSSYPLIVTSLLSLWAGLRASQSTGRVRTGTLAGLWAGLIGSVILWGYSSVFLFILDRIPLAPVIVLAAAAFNISVTLGLGTGFGTLGGWLERKRTPRATEVQNPSSFPALPGKDRGRGQAIAGLTLGIMSSLLGLIGLGSILVINMGFLTQAQAQVLSTLFWDALLGAALVALVGIVFSALGLRALSRNGLAMAGAGLVLSIIGLVLAAGTPFFLFLKVLSEI
jgi:hypothetical protein